MPLKNTFLQFLKIILSWNTYSYRYHKSKFLETYTATTHTKDNRKFKYQIIPEFQNLIYVECHVNNFPIKPAMAVWCEGKCKQA
jgi:hypothetical protein